MFHHDNPRPQTSGGLAKIVGSGLGCVFQLSMLVLSCNFYYNLFCFIPGYTINWNLVKYFSEKERWVIEQNGHCTIHINEIIFFSKFINKFSCGINLC